MSSSSSAPTSSTFATQIAPGVWHFATPPFNWYVLVEGGRVTVVDCGFPGHYAALLRGLALLGLGVGDVEAIVVTHAHADHLGFAHRLSLAARAPIYLHQDDQRAAQRFLQLPWPGLLANARRAWGRHILFSAVGAGILRLTRVPVSCGLRGGELLDVPGRPRVVAMPGHTPGQIALWCEGSRTLLAGDALLTQNLLTGECATPQLGPASLTWNDEVAAQSLERVKGLGTLTLATGHGPVWRGEAAMAVEQALSSARRG